MRKIPSLYVRNPDDMRYVLREVHPKCQWVIDGEGTATVKWDGTCVLLDDKGGWWARHQVRPGKKVPDVYVPLETDPVTGKTQGWIPADQSSYMRWLAEALGNEEDLPELSPGTYELLGPKVGGNPHQEEAHVLIRHGAAHLISVPTGYDALATFLREANTEGYYFEGVVWHHPDGRMAKIKTRDFPR